MRYNGFMATALGAAVLTVTGAAFAEKLATQEGMQQREQGSQGSAGQAGMQGRQQRAPQGTTGQSPRGEAMTGQDMEGQGQPAPKGTEGMQGLQGRRAQNPSAQTAKVAVQGNVQGEISKVDFQKGEVTIKTPEGSSKYMAKPNQIAGLRTGEQIQAPFAVYGDTTWLASHMDQQARGRQFGRTGQATGDIRELDKTKGTLTLSTSSEKDMTLQAHPGEIESLLPGQFVTVEFYRVGRTDWVQSIRSAAGASPQP
ncbi:MAG: hypothetical protein KA712_08145 [Myxococcales bacterium]|nr:hypothetical protein [Myxococcales bacterium]